MGFYRILAFQDLPNPGVVEKLRPRHVVGAHFILTFQVTALTKM
jgi:hypothetical protein